MTGTWRVLRAELYHLLRSRVTHGAVLFLLLVPFLHVGVAHLFDAAARVAAAQRGKQRLGLDEGPVFEKGLRPTKLPVSQGVRVVLANEAAHRLHEFVDLISEHSPKHTAPFMNMVLGSLEGGAGDAGLREDVVLLTAKRW